MNIRKLIESKLFEDKELSDEEFFNLIKSKFPKADKLSNVASKEFDKRGHFWNYNYRISGDYPAIKFQGAFHTNILVFINKGNERRTGRWIWGKDENGEIDKYGIIRLNAADSSKLVNSFFVDTLDEFKDILDKIADDLDIMKKARSRVSSNDHDFKSSSIFSYSGEEIANYIEKNTKGQLYFLLGGMRGEKWASYGRSGYDPTFHKTKCPAYDIISWFTDCELSSELTSNYDNLLSSLVSWDKDEFIKSFNNLKKIARENQAAKNAEPDLKHREEVKGVLENIWRNNINKLKYNKSIRNLKMLSIDDHI